MAENPSTTVNVPTRHCTQCLAHVTKRDAKFVATDSGGLEWFDCGEHPLTNRSSHVQLTPIDQWFRDRVPLPEGQVWAKPGSD